MAKVTPISEHFQHFLADLKETFWGDVYGQTRLAWQRFFQLESERQRDRFAGWGWYERGARKRRQYRNGYYERDFIPDPCGANYVLRMRLSATSWKCGAAPGPMACFVNVKSVDRIIYSIFQRFNLERKTRTLSVFTQAA